MQVLQDIGNFFKAIGDFFLSIFQSAGMIVEKLAAAAEWVAEFGSDAAAVLSGLLPADALSWVLAALAIVVAIAILEAIL